MFETGLSYWIKIINYNLHKVDFKIFQKQFQISSRLASLRAANGLVLLPPKTEEKKTAKKGEIMNAMVIGHLFQ